MSDPNPEGLANQIKEALFAGNKIEAIKLYREQTSLGLAESKAAVEKIETELRIAMPERFAKPQAKGCASVILAVGLVAVWRFFV